MIEDSHFIQINANEMGEHLDILFMLDFDVIEFRLPKKMVPYRLFSSGAKVEDFKKHEWQTIIDFTCELLGKEKRNVFSFNQHQTIKDNNFHPFVFIPLSSEPLYFGWEYFIETPKELLTKFWTLHDLNNDSCNTVKYKIHGLIENTFRALKGQGILKRQDYYQPSPYLIETFIKKFKKNIYEKS